MSEGVGPQRAEREGERAVEGGIRRGGGRRDVFGQFLLAAVRCYN